MSYKPFWILLARNGDTIDGRHITAEALSDMASAYSPDDYTAHIYTTNYLGPRFPVLGSILAAKIELQGDDSCLYAFFEPNEHWFNVLSADTLQNVPVYPALEYLPTMPNSAKPYITGMFLTTTPTIKNLEPLNKYMVKS